MARWCEAKSELTVEIIVARHSDVAAAAAAASVDFAAVISMAI